MTDYGIDARIEMLKNGSSCETMCQVSVNCDTAVVITPACGKIVLAYARGRGEFIRGVVDEALC